MQREELKDWTREQLEDAIRIAYIGGESIEKELIRQGNRIKTLEEANKELKTENIALKQRIKDIEDVCDGSCFSDYEDLPFGDDEDEKDRLIAELQDQHQQDCIKINQLNVTIDTLVDKYSRLRKTLRMD